MDPITSLETAAEAARAAPRTRFPFIARRLPPFTPRQWRVFWISTTAGYFDNYDSALLSLALKQIQQGLGIAEASLGAMFSAVRLGNLGAMLIAPLADVYGRRRLLLYTIAGYTIFTGLSAFAPGARSFIAAQVLARIFSGSEVTISLVLLAEEMDAAVRGWAIGLWEALAICGYGLAAIVFAFITVMPFGWRGLYTLALIPLFLLIPLRRALPESRRFDAEVAAGRRPPSVFAPIVALGRAYPGRLASIGGVWFLYTLGASPANVFIPKYLQEVLHWSPANVSSLYVFGGAIGILGSIVAGRASDRFGRRTMGVAFMLGGPALQLMIYSVGGRWVSAYWIAWLFCEQATMTILNAYGTELFPTSQRAAAGSALMVAKSGGGAIGLMLETIFYSAAGSHWRAIRWLLGFWFAAAILMLILFPETAGRELEATAPEAGDATVT
ncbi:MAG TPA: MFS transporter [Candidatus Binataceae bacterium]|nr:MFS transporter [Candidatus Binataceae bacterium]